MPTEVSMSLHFLHIYSLYSQQWQHTVHYLLSHSLPCSFPLMLICCYTSTFISCTTVYLRHWTESCQYMLLLSPPFLPYNLAWKPFLKSPKFLCQVQWWWPSRKVSWNQATYIQIHCGTPDVLTVLQGLDESVHIFSWATYSIQVATIVPSYVPFYWWDSSMHVPTPISVSVICVGGWCDPILAWDKKEVAFNGDKKAVTYHKPWDNLWGYFNGTWAFGFSLCITQLEIPYTSFWLCMFHGFKTYAGLDPPRSPKDDIVLLYDALGQQSSFKISEGNIT